VICLFRCLKCTADWQKKFLTLAHVYCLQWTELGWLLQHTYQSQQLHKTALVVLSGRHRETISQQKQQKPCFRANQRGSSACGINGEASRCMALQRHKQHTRHLHDDASAAKCWPYKQQGECNQSLHKKELHEAVQKL